MKFRLNFGLVPLSNAKLFYEEKKHKKDKTQEIQNFEYG